MVMIIVDTLRPDHLPIYGYSRSTTPGIEGFLDHADIYERAYSTHACTPPSVISLLSGLYPPHHGVRSFAQRVGDEITLLPEYLAGAGYQTAGFVSNFVLTDESIGLGRRFEFYDDFTDEPQSTRNDFYERRAARTTDAALRWLLQIRDPDRPFFLLLHYMDPHGPYEPPETVRDFRHEASLPINQEKIKPFSVLPNVNDAFEYIDRYDEEIAYTDLHIDRFLSNFEKLGLASESIMLFTADHGENMIEHEPWFDHCDQVWESIMRVPLIVRHPHQTESHRFNHVVSAVDVVPELLSLLNLRRPEGLDGVSFDERRDVGFVLLESQGARSAPVWHRGMVDEAHKWVVDLRKGTTEIVGKRTFDLAADPGELQSLPWLDTPVSRSFLDQISQDSEPEGRGTKGRSVRKSAPRLTEQAIDALRSLGYLD